jgi:hypothetical protein
MQDPSDSMEIAGPEENGQSSTAGSPAADDPAPDSEIDSARADSSAWISARRPHQDRAQHLPTIPVCRISASAGQRPPADPPRPTRLPYLLTPAFDRAERPVRAWHSQPHLQSASRS